MYDVKVFQQYADGKGGARGWNNDLSITDHDIAMLQGEDETVQSMVKSLLTVRGQVPLLAGYGSELQSLIGQRMTDTVKTNLASDVSFCLGYLTSLRPSSLPTITPDQLITSISNVSLEQDHSDTRGYRLKVQVTLKSKDTITVSLGGF